MHKDGSYNLSIEYKVVLYNEFALFDWKLEFCVKKTLKIWELSDLKTLKSHFSIVYEALPILFTLCNPCRVYLKEEMENLGIFIDFEFEFL